ncbi:alkaline phosphatase family protein [bacterium]|nr:alkaline phosphatase family protein [bacterium]
MKRALLILLLAVVAGVATAADGPKVLVIGFDGMDPVLLQRFRDEGAMPNFDRFVKGGGAVTPFATSTPPQSPVAWSNFITGRDPGGHGIFDFIHRDPQTLLPFFSASEAKGPTRFWRLGDWKLPRGSAEVRNLRKGTAFWELLSDAGVDVTIFKVPSNFPPVECEARSLSGMGTPDITGNYGISTMITDDPPVNRDLGGGRVVSVYLEKGRFVADLLGPPNSYRDGDPEAKVDVTGRVDRSTRAVWLSVGDAEVVLNEGEWSDWVTVEFEMIPLLKGVRGICRFYLIEAAPHLRLYVTPVQIDPVEPAMPISTPESYSREIADDTGLFYTQGLPDDTSALENGFFDDEGYVQQSGLVLHERLAQLGAELDRFAALDSGLLFFYFNSPDQTCHMMWRNMDAASPTHADADPAHALRIRHVYEELDAALGLAMAKAGPDATVMIMSDHGFAPWNRAFHLNTWLYENGYLALQEGVAPGDVQMLNGVDWWRTKAYAIGINGLYVNLAGREQQGSVQGEEARRALLAEIKAKLEAVVDPLDGRRAVKRADLADEVYHGDLRNAGPDMVVGYYAGWRGSNESALGRIMPTVFEDNMLKWSGDHCIAADEVPGVLLANRPIARSEPALVDMAPTILKLFGVPVPPEMVGGDLFSPR